MSLLPQSLCLLHKVMPTAYVNNTIKLAMVNPSNLVAFDDVRRYIKGAVIEPQVCTEEDFQKFMDTLYPEIMGSRGKTQETDAETAERVSLADLQAQVLSNLEVQEEEDERPTPAELATASEDAPIVRIANNILALAIKKGGVQHIQVGERLNLGIAPAQEGYHIGCAHVRPHPHELIGHQPAGALGWEAQQRAHLGGIARLHRCQQLVLPIGHVLGQNLSDIVHRQTVEKLRGMIHQPYGIIYVTGPTGSGKTTTLYSLLSEINSTEIKISTAEDPIEYDLPGLCQVQAHGDIGLDFARILRAFLRQDPDVILVGETRDRETAKISVEAAITGHLVFTTLHTNDAPSSFTRLQEMGIEPFLMANSTIGVLAQRLARRLCPNCKVETTVDEGALGFFGYTKETAPPFYKGQGCEKCNNTGKRGRVGIFELLVMNDELRSAVANGAKTDVIREISRRHGMKTLKEYAMFLMAEGLTSLDEVVANLVIEN